jgi:hypothetical protein
LASSQKACVLGPFGISSARAKFALAKILRAKEFLGGDDLRALVRRGVGELQGALQVGNRIGIGPGLQKPQSYLLRCGHKEFYFRTYFKNSKDRIENFTRFLSLVPKLRLKTRGKGQAELILRTCGRQ